MAEASVDASAMTYRGPDPKALTSARLRQSVRQGIEAVVLKWKLRAEDVGDQADGIDKTYVMDAILAAGIRDELKPFLDEDGQLPTSESAWEAVHARIKKSTR